jgi:hypothetical protein
MKTLLLSTVICAATLSFNTSASLKSASNFKFVGDTQYAGLCEAAATNDLGLFKKNVRKHASHLTASKSKLIMLLANGEHFQCAGQDLVAFSESRGSQSIADFLTASNPEIDTASTSKYQFVGDKNFKNFCKSAVTNNVSLFKRAISNQIGLLGFSKKEVMDKVLDADNVTCAGESLGEFFESREATNVISFIAEESAK